MKFVCDGLTLAEAVGKVTKACAVRTTAPIYECIKITAKGEEVAFLATDGELSIRKAVKAEIFEEGEACVPGKLFSDFLSKLSSEEVSVSTSDRSVAIKYGDSVSYLQYLNAEEFPKINFEIGENHFVLKQKELKRAISNTVFCCAQDDSRPILKGCLMEFGEELEMTALDGYRLALSKAPVLAKQTEESVICPARALNEIVRMLSDDESEITLYTEGGTLMVNLDGLTVVTRLYVGEFIKKDNVIPRLFSSYITVSREELTRSVERAAVFIRGDKNNLVTLDVKGGIMKISSVSEVGNVSESIAIELDGKDLTISMNAKYLLDGLKALDEEKIVISFNGALSPFILQNNEKKEGLYLILPVRNAS